MKLFFHYCPYGFSNCYILGSDFDQEGGGPQQSRDALIIDPGNMDVQILEFIEGNNYTLRGVLLSHDHAGHTHGLTTIRRIYDAGVYAVNHMVGDVKTNKVKDGDRLSLGSFSIEVISVPGHSSDSAVYKIDRLLFTGDALSAGLVGSTASSYGAEVQMNALQHKILSLPGNFVVLPGHGPLSSLDAERRFNAGIQQYEQQRSMRPSRRG